MRGYFRFDEYQTNYQREIIGGLTTFITMAYIIIVNPAILEEAGIPRGPSTVATIVTAFLGTLFMGIYARRPFAIAPYMGENAFIAYTVVKIMGYSWQTALGAIFISGVLFTILTLVKIRIWLAKAVPETLKYSFAVGIGLFLTFIGLHDMGVVVSGTGTPVTLGNLAQPNVLLAILGFIIISFLLIFRVNAAILIGIVTITLLSFLFKITPIPSQIMSMPPSIAPVFLKLDLAGTITWGFIGVILTVFIMDFLDTMGTLIGVSARANLLDEAGNLPEIEKPMLVDALSTIVAALCGTTTAGAYIESATGIQAGARTGFSAIVTSLLFLLALFFAPFLTAVPTHAYGPALVIVGLLMVSVVTRINFNDFSELVPSFLVIVLMSFTYNIGIGMTAGFVIFPLFKIFAGKWQAVHPGLWILAALSLLFFIFYPYQ